MQYQHRSVYLILKNYVMPSVFCIQDQHAWVFTGPMGLIPGIDNVILPIESPFLSLECYIGLICYELQNYAWIGKIPEKEL